MPTNVISLYSFEITLTKKMSPVLGLFFKPTLFYVPRFFSKAGNKDSGSSPITAPPELWKSFE
jgi:hypothetical protein